jgi:hypothetical protein
MHFSSRQRFAYIEIHNAFFHVGHACPMWKLPQTMRALPIQHRRKKLMGDNGGDDRGGEIVALPAGRVWFTSSSGCFRMPRRYGQCPFIGVERKSSAHAQNGAFDPIAAERHSGTK